MIQNIFEKLFQWYGKRNVIIASSLIIVLPGIGIYLTIKNDTADLSDAPLLPTVEVKNVSNLSNQSSVSLIGSVEAVSQAELKSDVGGRVVAVNAKLGDTVPAGKVIVQLENANQRAALLQAEGSYEATLAATAQSDISVNSAESSVTTAENNLSSVKSDIFDLYRSSYNTVNQIVLQEIDDFYVNPLILQPRVKIDSRTYSNYLISERIALRDVLKNWQDNLSQTTSLQPTDALINIQSDVIKVSELLNVFIELLSRASDEVYFTDDQIDGALTDLIASRASLNSILNDIETKKTSLANAEQNLISAQNSLSQAQIAGSNSDISASDAQIKQALGSLRNAQANLAKTLITTTISGVVNSLDVKIGDFIAPQATLGLVANNNALEVTTYVGETDRNLITLGKTVMIDNKFEGIVTNIAPAINPITKKIEIKISTESDQLQNGDSVLITLSNLEQESADTRIMVPITAVKFTQQDGSIFTVENNQLVSHPVEIGKIDGSFVEILSGISLTQEIVVDARGKSAGQQVEAVSSN
jgi:multidrug efflux pump subunit AcrA (membrane-fusion protein)